MAATPESKVKKLVSAQLKMLGAYYFYPVTSGFGRSGVPDIVGCYRGRFFGIECKAGKNSLTDLQRKNLEQIQENGGVALVATETNATRMAEILSHATWETSGEKGWDSDE
jgi:Holliday junction resolvase